MIRIFIDENIPFRLVTALRNKEFDVKSAIEQMKGAKDKDVLKFAALERRILITLDKEFASMVYRSKIENAGIILIRLKKYASDDILHNVLKLFKKFKKTILEKSFIIISEKNIRIRSF